VNWWAIRFPLLGFVEEHRGAGSVDIPVHTRFAATEAEAIAWASGYVAAKGWPTDHREARVERRPEAT
jgi:hypothetical protein